MYPKVSGSVLWLESADLFLYHDSSEVRQFIWGRYTLSRTWAWERMAFDIFFNIKDDEMGIEGKSVEERINKTKIHHVWRLSRYC